MIDCAHFTRYKYIPVSKIGHAQKLTLFGAHQINPAYLYK